MLKSISAQGRYQSTYSKWIRERADQKLKFALYLEELAGLQKP